jgi:large subunit ribosomal protein L40e
MQIYIKTLSGRKQPLSAESNDTVMSLKQQLQEKEGIEVPQIRLIHSGKALADEKSLEESSIKAGDTIHMVLQLRGGC